MAVKLNTFFVFVWDSGGSLFSRTLHKKPRSVCLKIRGPVWLGLFLLLCCAVPALAQQEGVIIRSIEIQGNKRVDSSNILFYIKSKVGEPISRNRIRKDIENIYELGQFSDIRVETKPAKTDGVRLIFILEEIPSVGEVEFSGNTIGVEDLLGEIAVKRGIAFEDYLIKDTRQKLIRFYHEKGYFLVEVKVSTKTTPEGLVDVNIDIREGEKVRIQKIRFVGNKAVDTDDLEDVMETEEESWISFLDESGIYKKDVLKIDVLRLEAYYQDQGFLRVRVEDPIIKINKKEKEIYLTLKIEEGERYKIRSIKVSGDSTFTQKKLRDMVGLKEGDFYNVSQLRKDALDITELFSERGYAYADVTPQTQIDDKKKTVDVNIVIDKGRKVYVGEINLIGNIKTRDNVIRREFRLKEGDLFDSKKLKRSKARIRNLGFFEDVGLDTHRGKTPELIDIDTVVTEQPTGSISFGAGFSSVENVIFTASVSQDNLFGYGQNLSLSTEISSIRTDFDIRFTEPRIFDSEISVGVDAFNRETDYFSFDSKSVGGGLRLGKSLSETDWVGLAYRFSRVEISDVAPADETVFLMNGIQTASRIGPTFIRDTRDNFINPTKGWRHVIRFEIAGSILGGEDFYKTRYEMSYYHPLIGKLVGLVHGVVNYADGYNGASLPAFERHFMGGPTTLRGYTIREVGPLDRKGDPLGGEQSLLFNLELQYPLTKAFRVFVFYDRGNVYGDGVDISSTARNIDITKMREGVGAGIRFLSPLGPIGLAYGVKLDPRPGDSSGEFHFSAGRAF